MITKKVLNPKRLRRIEGGFSFIPHRFTRDGFLSSLSQKELLLYLFLCLVSDRNGLSYYSYDVICSLLQLSSDEYIEARDGLMRKDLIAFDGTIFQVLDLPESPVQPSPAKAVLEPAHRGHRSKIQSLIQQSLWGAEGGR
ncbi:MAG: helix-turn-helix domain-containing protein [Deltaproteobacteria bacterium]|nr:helix-turn-helix domain-containing protein [Deltaproteobacteria bacterium]